MSLLQQTPLITLLDPYEGKDDRKTFTYEVEFEDGTKCRRQVPIDDGVVRGGAEGILTTMNAIRLHSPRLNYHGHEVFDALGDCLQGRMLQAYNRVRAKAHWADDDNCTTDHDADHDEFTNFVNDIIDDYHKATTEGLLKKVVIAHLRNGTQRKPRSMAPLMLEQRIDDLKLVLKVMRPYDLLLTAAEWKEVYFNAHPDAYQLAFASVPRDINSPNETITTIQQYFTMRWNREQQDKKPAAKADASNDQGPRKSNKRKRSDEKKAAKKNKSSNNLKNPCKRAGCQGKRPHDWEQCFYNRNGSNYQPNLRGNQGNQGNSQGNSNRGNNSNNRNDNHHNDSATAGSAAGSRAAVSNSGSTNDNHFNEVPANIGRNRDDYLLDTDDEDDLASLFSSATRDQRRRFRHWLREDRERRDRERRAGNNEA